MFCGLEEEELTKIRKKKKEKKEKKREINLIATKSGLVGMKGNFKVYNHMKYFLPYLCRFDWDGFLRQTIAKRFSGSKTKVT